MPGSDVERELLRVEVVLEQRHRERQRDPRPEAPRRRRLPAVDGRAGERSTVRIEPGDAEQAQDGPFLPDRRRRAGAGAPRPGQCFRPRDDAVERPPVSRHPRSMARRTVTNPRRLPGGLPRGNRGTRAPGRRRRRGCHGRRPARPRARWRQVGLDATPVVDLDDDRDRHLQDVQRARRGGTDRALGTGPEEVGGDRRVERRGRVPPERRLDHDPLGPRQPGRDLLGQRVVAATSPTGMPHAPSTSAFSPYSPVGRPSSRVSTGPPE